MSHVSTQSAYTEPTIKKLIEQKKALSSLLGSDCSGGAGIQADIETITAHKMYAMSAITALTAQNTTGVYGILRFNGTDLPQWLSSALTALGQLYYF